MPSKLFQQLADRQMQAGLGLIQAAGLAGVQRG
jgi:hypothetical protein